MPRRPNYRGRPVVFPLGVALLMASVVALAASPSRWVVFLTGVAALGLVDDLVEAGPRGWRGHGRALLRGEPSTGALKAAGTLALAAYAGTGGLAEVFVLVLATHVGNLLDTRPGRTEKGFLVAALLACASAGGLTPLAPIAPLLAPVAIAASLTLRERAMLGDSGASLIGAMAGVCLVSALDGAAIYAALAALAAISLYGEFRSVAATVERVPLLQRLDSLGRVRS